MLKKQFKKKKVKSEVKLLLNFFFFFFNISTRKCKAEILSSKLYTNSRVGHYEPLLTSPFVMVVL